MKPALEKKEDMVFKGIPASPGITIGPIFHLEKHTPAVFEKILHEEEIQGEIDRLVQAVERSQKELSKILEFAEKKLGTNESKIFEAQLMILQDEILFDVIYGRIRKEFKNAEYVIDHEIGKYHRLMLASNDEYTRERAQDVEDVRNRILRNLQAQKLISRLEGSSIICCHNLSAADALILSRNEVLGYATDVGGMTSHLALLARALKIPAVVGLHTISTMIHSADKVVLDGYSGVVVLHPSEKTMQKYERKKEQYHKFEQKLSGLRELPAETIDGRRVDLSANVELEQELEFTRFQGSDGIGLYRSEVLLLGKEVFPPEEEQYQQYKLLADSMFPKRVIIRTFDIGGDKYMAQPEHEANPFLGWRGIRVMLDRPELFNDQLRAILRASARKNIAIMFPMVSTLHELRLAKKMLEDVKRQLRKENLPFDDKIKIGAMIEVPAAAVVAEDLAEEVSFLSIGTNDLIQYLLAVDRTNDRVSGLYQEFNPSVVRFLRRIIERGKKKKVWVGMCGAMAGDPLATILLLGLGLDEFSVVPDILPEIKKIIRSVKYSDAQKIAKHVLRLKTEEEVQEFLRDVMKKKLPDIPLT
ncbi:MAG: phosphoenolpyruvate--protein phosphotransferase [bacterium]